MSPEVLTEGEVSAIRQYHSSWDSHSDEVPYERIPPEQVQELAAAWRELRRAARMGSVIYSRAEGGPRMPVMTEEQPFRLVGRNTHLVSSKMGVHCNDLPRRWEGVA